MIEILRIVGAFGIRGAVRVLLFTRNLDKYKKIYNKNGEGFFFRILKNVKENSAVVLLEGVNNRNDAERLNNEFFYVKKNELPAVTKSEFYLCDLIGQKVCVLGADIECTITNVQNFGAGDLIEISHLGRTFLVPFTIENFPDFDDKIVITLVAFEGFKN